MRVFAAAAALVIASTAPAFAAALQTVVLDVQNMTCGLCPITVKKSLERVPGVVDARVNLAEKTATVKFDPEKASITTLINATANAGFPATARH